MGIILGVFVCDLLVSLHPHRKTQASCDEGPVSDPPKVLKEFNRCLLFEGVSRAEPGALEGLLEYLQFHEKRLTDEEFRGQTPGVGDRKSTRLNSSHL